MTSLLGGVQITDISSQHKHSAAAKRWLVFIAPGFAAFDTFTHLHSIFELGSTAAAIREHWRPVTREFWSWLLNNVFHLPIDLTTADKDSLTAVAFFAPLAITSVVRALSKQVPSEKSELNSGVVQSSLIRSAAILLAIGMLFLLSRQLVLDFLSLLDLGGQNYRVTPVLSFLAFAVLAIYAAIAFATYFARSGISFRRQLVRLATTSAGIVELLIFAAPLVIGVYFATSQLSDIRVFSIAVVIVSILATIAVSPRSIIIMAYCIFGLAIASLAWDFWAHLKQSIDTVPKS